MRTRKFLAIGSTLLLVAGLFSLGTSAASAHTPNVSASCSELSVSLTSYNQSFRNTVTVTIDGTVVDQNDNFGKSYVKTFTFSNPAVAHTWSVNYTAGDNAQWSGTKSGTSTPCVNEGKITLCHANQGVKNWTSNNVSISSVIKKNGHDSHSGDIIPAFAYESNGATVQYPGKNLTTDYSGFSGQAVLTNGCSIPSPTVVTPAVTFTDNCGISSDTYSTTPVTGVAYSVSDKLVNGARVVSITATTTSAAYVFAKGATTTWTHTFTNVPCPVEVKAIPAVTFTDLCGLTDDAYSSTPTTGVEYSVTDSRVNGVGVVTVTAAPAAGFVFATGLTTSWSHTFTNTPCPIVVRVVPAATFTDECGTAQDTVSTIDTTGVIYSTDDQRVDGAGVVTVTAAPAPGYVFKTGATTSWSHTFTNTPCLIVVSAVPGVTFTDACGTANDTVNVTDTTGVIYSKNDQRVNGVGTVTVTAAPAAGYVFDSSVKTTSWSYTFTDVPCETKVKAIKPLATDPTCPEELDAHSGYISVTMVTGLAYTIDGTPVTQVRTDVLPGDHVIGVTALPGYVLEGPSSWTMNVKEPVCPPTLALLSTTASMKNLTCSGAGSYTLAATEGVLWFVNGATTPTAPGTYKVTDATTVNVQAKLADPTLDGWEDGAQTAWTFSFTHTADCLPTLAFTGTDGGNLGLLLAGGMLLFGGTIIAFERRFRSTSR